ncbi:MAG: HU family DNA-binding protein [Paludibacteraceae bacterium]|nr:HU family DNA-binding protein [Paludibacteraceae bacterium]
MNNKVTLQDLADQLSAISGQSKKLSEGFLRALTEIVEEALAKDGIAKVKGIGTFKIVAIEERKSVSVTDGSAVIIPAHKKITFTPEKELKEAVNKPYEDLETYVLPSDGPVDGPFIDEDEEEGEDLTSTTDYTTTNPEETSAWTSSVNASTTPSEPTVAQTPTSTIEAKTETPQAFQPVSSPSPAEPVTPSYDYTSNAYSTPSAGTPTAEANITSNNPVETVGAQSPIQETTTPPVSEPTPAPEPTITSTAAPAPEAPIANEPVADTCAPVGHTPAEEIKQTAENTIPSEEPQQTTSAPSVETPQATTSSTTTTSEESVKQGEPTATQEPQGEAEQPAQSEVKEEPVQNAAPTGNAGEATDKKEEPTATTASNEPAAQATDSTQQAAQNSQAQAAAAATSGAIHNGKHKHHKKKKERNKGLLAVIIILALLIIACLVYALRSDKGFSNGLNDLKGKITGIFSDNKPVPTVVDSALTAESISEEQAEVDEFFEEKTEDMYEAAQADQEFPVEVETEQNWDWFEEGVKKFIKKEYPKINFEVKGEPVMDTIRRGQTLTSMSRKHYNGVKDFWVYIYLYNKDVIRRPDDVSVGTPIKIPQLDESVIDPNSYMSINAAKDVKESYLRLFN